MGCTNSKQFVLDENVFGFDTKSKNFYIDQLGLNGHDLDLLYTSFYDMDSDNSGAIRIEEFLVYFELEHNAINNKIFSVFETDKCLSFMTYVTTLWYFLSLDSKRVGTFTYRMYDENKSDSMTIPGIVEMMQIVNQDEQGNFEKIDKAVKSLPGYGERRTDINLNTFSSWAEKNQTIFMPIMKCQFTLREKLLGPDYWRAQEEKREKSDKLTDPYVDIFLRSKMQDIKFEHQNMLRQRQLSEQRISAKGQGPGRNRLTHIMINKLNRSNEPKREKKGEVSAGGEDVVSDLPALKKKDKGPPPVTENRRRRSVFKPNLVEKPSSSTNKVAPSSGQRSSKGKDKYAY